MSIALCCHFSASIFISSSDLAFEIWSMSTACPPATWGEHKHPSKQHSRCLPVRPAAHKDEKTADSSLTTSPGWATLQPPELNLASAEAKPAYFISTSSIYFCWLYVVGWNLTKFTTTKNEFKPPHPALPGISYLRTMVYETFGSSQPYLAQHKVTHPRTKPVASARHRHEAPSLSPWVRCEE